MPFFDLVTDGVYLFRDTCNVYVIVAAGPDDATHGIAIDFGGGDVLSHLDELDLASLDAILMTHHHRDQGQGLFRAIELGIPVYVPPVEQDLFAAVDQMWSTRQLVNDYNLQQDRFSLIEPIPIAGTAALYREVDYGGIRVRALSTPGHTMGSVTYVVDRSDGRLAFTGDLIYAPGKVWSLAATQWSYTGNEGPAMTVLSAQLLRREAPSVLLPSHGDIMINADSSLALLAQRMQAYIDSRRIEPWDLTDWLEHPYESISPHLLLNKTSNACSYVVLSDSGNALIIDYGYDASTGWPPGTTRAARLPWLASLPALKRDFGVTRIDVALATHYHDDHVAGLNLLREVEGTEVWLPEHVALVMADPMATDLPCQWFDPIPADRVLPLGGTVRWQEYEITTHDLPGHTRYAAAFELEVDGVIVLATGDQQTALGRSGANQEILNYQYRNLFRPIDYQRSAQLYKEVAPGLLVTGHWGVHDVTADYVQTLADQAQELLDVHQALLPSDLRFWGGTGPARIEPFFCELGAGAESWYWVEVENPYQVGTEAEVSLVLPLGWSVDQAQRRIQLQPSMSGQLRFRVQVGARPGRRQRITADVTIGGTRFGQIADAVVDVIERETGPRTPQVDLSPN